MATEELQADLRQDLKKNKVKKLRLNGQIPGIVYGGESEPIPVTVNYRDVEVLFKGSKGRNVVFNIKINKEGKEASEHVMAYNIDYNAVSRRMTHIDFIRVLDTVPVRAEVNVILVGDAPGLKFGGVLIHKMRSLVIRCIPTKIPDAIEVDLSNMGIGDFIRVKDLKSETYKMLSYPEETIVRLAAPRTQVEMDAMDADPVEGEEAAEGEEGAEASSDGKESGAPAEGDNDKGDA